MADVEPAAIEDRAHLVAEHGLVDPEAIDRAYAGVAKISFDGMQYRRDIGRSTYASVDCSDTREAVPPMWNVLIVSCVPGSPMD